MDAIPIKCAPGGATSIKKPARNPAIAPTSGPFVTAQQQTITITKSGVAPGSESRARKVGWKITARKIVEIKAKYLYIFIIFDLD